MKLQAAPFYFSILLRIHFPFSHEHHCHPPRRLMESPENRTIILTIVFLLALFRASSSSQTFKTYSFSQFNQTHRTQFDFLNNSTISQGSLQITPDTSNNDYKIENQSGRVLYKEKFRLFDAGGGFTKLASFNTSFLFNIYYRPNTSGIGEGLSFIVAPDTNIPNNSDGQYIGLTNATIDGNPSNSFLAVEFDTVKQDFDPDDNHVGIDINSIRSNKTFSLSSLGIELSPKINATKYLAWIDYNGSAKVLSVYIGKDGETKPAKSVLNYSIDTSAILKEYSYFGFAASTGKEAELNCILAWNLTVEVLPEKKKLVWQVSVFAIALPVLIVVIALSSTVVWFVWYRRRTKDNPLIVGALKSLPGMPSEFAFGDLKKSTNNFDEKLKLGQGGFGVVYKGTLPKEGKVVAVKKFSRESMKGIDDFLAELAIINRLRHKNLVKLIGWCHRRGVLLIVYDFMPNGSLDKHLFDSSGSTLSWERRYNIVSGVASALHYLHNEYDHRVVHRDIKASNIMLDSDFNARLGDFGLARVLDDEKTSYVEAEGMPGTVGYIAPECFHTGKATRESDVFSFGAVVLEVVTGRRPRSTDTGFLVDHVWTLYREGRILEAVDERMEDNFDQQDAVRMLLLGLACSHPNPNDRPKTESIIQIISRSVNPPHVPPFRPPFIWHMGMDNESSSTNVASSSVTDFSSNWTSLSLSRGAIA